MAINISGMAEYQAVIDKINLWYGSDAQKVINIVNQYELTPQQVATDYLSGSGFEPWYTTSGAIGGYVSSGTSPINPATAAQEAANSNVGTTTQIALRTPVETTVNQSGKVEASAGLTSVATGTKSPLTFITQEVLPAISAAGLGVTLGKAIDSALYNANPDFWDNNGMSSLNPETWNNITQDYPDGFLKKAFNTIFGLNPTTGETQLYLDEQAAAYLAAYMHQNGVFAPAESTVTPDSSVSLPWNNVQPPIPFGTSVEFSTVTRDGVRYKYQTITALHGRLAAFVKNNGNTFYCVIADEANTSSYRQIATVTTYDVNGNITNTQTLRTNSYETYDYKTVRYVYQSITPAYGAIIVNGPYLSVADISGNDYRATAWTLAYGTVHQASSLDGVTDQEGATLPDFSGCETPADYLNALRTQFPDMFNNAVTQSVVNPDGSTTTKTYVPIGTPSSGNTTQPVTTGTNSGNQQDGQAANPNTVDLTGLQNLIDQLTKTISETGTPTDTTNPDPTGTGTTPPVVPPTGNASALWTVYNPTQAQLNQFGAWLWSSNFIDQLLKLFNNPMQSIIGVHKIFASPAISGSNNITVGYLDSGVAANVVGAQYTTINCGTVKVREHFGNVFDYNDTDVRLYLPFIGIVPLDVMDVMRGDVTVIYHVDVITGACLAEVKITRDGGGGTLYQFAGDAAVRYPISSGSYMGVVSGVLGVVGGIASGILSGGATLPMIAGAAGAMSSAKTNVQHSGSFAGNAGAMGAKRPYLIIERPQTAIAKNYKPYQGSGTNEIKTVGNMSGYFKMTNVRLNSITGASDSELEAIKTAFEQGVIA